MTIVDWILVGAIIVFAIAGWQRGFVAGLLSFAGFIGGGLLGAFLLPPIVSTFGLPDVARALVVFFGVLVMAVAGQVLASMLGRMVRGTMTWKPVRVVDNAGGAVLNVLALAVVAWILATAVAALPVSGVTQQVQDSKVLSGLDSLVPNPVRNAFGSLRDLVRSTDVPRIFSGFAQVPVPQVDAPSTGPLTAEVRAARASVLRVSGDTPECLGGVTGSGFVVAPGRVITNAHVVAGVDRPLVRLAVNGPGLPATVVYFDPGVDIAVLAVADLDAPALQLVNEAAATGDDAVVAGFPHGGPYQAVPARIRAVIDAHGDDIYGSAGVEREVYAFRGVVEPGNSGGPLLDLDGRALGMVFGSDEQEAELGYALSAQQLAGAVGEASELTSPVDTGSCRLR